MRKLRSNHVLIGLLFLISSIGPFASDTYLPSLPPMVIALGATHTSMQLTITIYLLGMGISQLFFGPFSDRFGRRKVAVIGLSISFISSLGCAASFSVGQLIFFRFLQGLGIGAGSTVARTALRDRYSGKKLAQIISYMSIVFALAPSVAPVLGGYLQHWLGWRSIFIFLLFYIASLLFLVCKYLPETIKIYNPSAMRLSVVLKNYSLLRKNKTFVNNLVCSSMALAAMVAYDTGSPFLLQTVLHVSVVTFGWLTALVAAGFVLSRTINALLIRKYETAQVLYGANLVMLATSFFVLITGLLGWLSLPVVIAPICVFFLGSSIVLPNASAAAFETTSTIAGSASAMYGCIQLLVCFIASGIIAHLHNNNQIPLGAVLSGCSICCLFSARHLIKHPVKSEA